LEERGFVKKVSVVLPALNEEESIGNVIDEIPVKELASRGYRTEVIVVNNGSSDKTAEIAAEHGAKVMEESNRGKGWAIRTGFGAVDGDFIFMLDSDFTYPAGHITQMLELLEDGYDVVLGSRLRGSVDHGAIKRFNLVGNHLLAFLANMLYGTRVSDLCTGFWGFKVEVLRSLNLDAVGFELEANMLIEVAKHKYRVGEVPIQYRKRTTASKLGSLKAGWRIGSTIVQKRFSR
jgi:glycosyltransferase involved in cell wall biosynthesis